MAEITAIILTRNEEKNIVPCIRSIRLISPEIRIAVVDSFSEDDTVALAKAQGAEVLCHEFENHGKQWQWAMEQLNVTTEWVMRVDADERFTVSSAEALRAFLSSEKEKAYNGILFRYNVYFMGKLLRYGSVSKFEKVTCYRVGAGYVQTDNMRDRMVADGGKYYTLREKLDHRDYKDLSAWIAKHNWYATGEALYSLSEGTAADRNCDGDSKRRLLLKRCLYDVLPSRLRTSLLFVLNYYFRFSFLNGREGYWYCFFRYKWYRTLADAKLAELRSNPSCNREMGKL